MKNLQKGSVDQILVGVITIFIIWVGIYNYLGIGKTNTVGVQKNTTTSTTPVTDVVARLADFITKKTYNETPVNTTNQQTETKTVAITKTTNETVTPPTVVVPVQNNNYYNMGVLVLKYFPTVIVGGVEKIDISVTGDIGGLYSSVRQFTIDTANSLKITLENATKYLGYKDSFATPALKYNIVDTFEYKEAVPTINYQGRLRYPDYNGIMQKHSICNYVDNKGVREVWIFAYQGPPKSDGQPSLDINESKMSSSLGDISNSQRYNEMPICKNAYVVYTYNYQRGVSEAMEDHMHQFEAQFRDLDLSLYNIFTGPFGQEGKDQSCGWAHYTPNSLHDYDWANKRYVMTDCFDWNPQGTGIKESVNCDKWSCNSVNWFTMWMQTVPGKNNKLTYNNKKLGNFWYFISNWNTAKSSDEFF